MNKKLMSAMTRRQRDVARELLEGYRVKTVAVRLGLSVSTVRNHLKRMFETAQVHSQDRLIASLRKSEPSASSSAAEWVRVWKNWPSYEVESHDRRYCVVGWAEVLWVRFPSGRTMAVDRATATGSTHVGQTEMGVMGFHVDFEGLSVFVPIERVEVARDSLSTVELADTKGWAEA